MRANTGGALRRPRRLQRQLLAPALSSTWGAIKQPDRRSASGPVFYYKTFKWPNWHLFEPAIRRMAGSSARASGERGSRSLRRGRRARGGRCLVVGRRGPRGPLSAAGLSRRRGRGARNTLLLAGRRHTRRRRLGVGAAILKSPELIARAKRAGWCGQMTRNLGVRDLRTIISSWRALKPCNRAAAPAAAGGRAFAKRLWKIRARAPVIRRRRRAGNAPMLFPNNGPSGSHVGRRRPTSYAHAFGVACGQRVVVAANSDSAYRGRCLPARRRRGMWFALVRSSAASRYRRPKHRTCVRS